MNIFEIDNEADYLQNKNDININENNKSSRNALFFADAKKTEWLIRNGINVNQVDADDKTALFYCDPDACKLLVSAGLDINYLSSDDSTPFSYYMKLKHMDETMTFDIVNLSENVILSKRKTLLELGANPNLVNNKGDNYLIHLNKNLPTVELLVEYGVDIQYLNNSKQNALFGASQKVTEYLVKNNINVNQIDINNNNAFFHPNNWLSLWSIDEDPNQAKIWLLDNTDINLNLDTADKIRLLTEDHNLVQKYILKSNDVNFNQNGDNFLSNTRDHEHAQFLIDNGINIHFLNNEGDSLLHKSNYPVSILLIQNGIDINHKNNDNHNALNRFFPNQESHQKTKKLSRNELFTLFIHSGMDFSNYRKFFNDIEKEIVARYEKEKLQNIIIESENITKPKKRL